MVRMTSDRRFCFGKYEGLTVDEVIKKDFQYVYYINSKIKFLFTDSEKRKIRNIHNKEINTDIYATNVKHRTKFEEEMYGLINKF